MAIAIARVMTNAYAIEKETVLVNGNVTARKPAMKGDGQTLQDTRDAQKKSLHLELGDMVGLLHHLVTQNLLPKLPNQTPRYRIATACRKCLKWSLRRARMSKTRTPL